MSSERANDSTHIVSVDAPARLHLGFVDMEGGYGRRFVSLGLPITGVATRLTATRADAVTVEGPGGDRASRYLQTIRERLGLKTGIHLRLLQAIPEHVGLGSGTQMALAVGTAASRLAGLALTSAELASLMGRGLRSGIGIAASEQGGFILDGGRGHNTVVPPVIARLPFPEQWRVLLIFDHNRQGVHGAGEAEAFAQLPTMTAATAAELCRRVLVQMLPALAEGQFDVFADAVKVVQDAMGDMFAAAQGGRYSSPRVAAVLDWLLGKGVRGIGQTSWGPTGFALFPDDSSALAAQAEARARWRDSSLEFVVVRGLNRGLAVQETRARQSGALAQALSS
jgi:beta-RFAP synthase